MLEPALAGASGDRGGVAGAMPDTGREGNRDGLGGQAEPMARLGSGALSLVNPMERPPLAVTERNDGGRLLSTPSHCQGANRNRKYHISA